MTPRLKEKYKKDIIPAMMKEFSYKNIMEAPKIQKVVLNVGLGETIGTADACRILSIHEATLHRLLRRDPTFPRPAFRVGNRLRFPEYRAPGSDKWERVTWEWAMDRIARLMKDDRDKNFVQKNAAGATVNRWQTVGFLAASASANETGYITGKVIRALGGVAIDNQARV